MIKQLKVATGDEVVCEVLEDDEFEIPVRNALRLISKEVDGYKYYTFKNFMVYQDRPESVSVIRAEHIVSYANPPEDLQLEWEKALEEMYAETSNKSLDYEMEMRDSGSNVVNFPKGPQIH